MPGEGTEPFTSCRVGIGLADSCDTCAIDYSGLRWDESMTANLKSEIEIRDPPVLSL